MIIDFTFQITSTFILLTPDTKYEYVICSFLLTKIFRKYLFEFLLHATRVFHKERSFSRDFFIYLHMLTPNTCFNFRLFHAWLTTPKTSLITNKNLLACLEFLWEKPFRWLLITVMILLWVCVEPTRKIVYFLCYRSCFSFANNNNQNNNI